MRGAVEKLARLLSSKEKLRIITKYISFIFSQGTRTVLALLNSFLGKESKLVSQFVQYHRLSAYTQLLVNLWFSVNTCMNSN